MPLRFSNERLIGWSPLGAEHPDVYVADYQDYPYDQIAMLSQEGMPLVPVNSIAEVQANPGSYWFDRGDAIVVSDNRLYAHFAAPYDPNTPSKEAPIDPNNADIRSGSAERMMLQGNLEFKKHHLLVTSLIPPGNFWSPSLIEIAKNHFTLVASGGNMVNPIPPSDFYNLTRRFIRWEHTLEDVKGWIEEAENSNGWLVICFHGFGTEKIDGTNTQAIDSGWDKGMWSKSKFRDLVKWVQHRSTISVVTLREGQRLIQQLPAN